MQQKKQKIAIVGLGRFGKLLTSILKADFELFVFDRNEQILNSWSVAEKANLTWANDISELYKAKAVFFCVPISKFEETICEHLQYFNPETLLVDVLSVKLYAKEIFDKYLPEDIQALLTHPMFGPDSVRMAGLVGQPLIMDKYKSDTANYEFWKTYFASKKIKIIEMSANEHDQLAAKSLGLAQFIGRVLEKANFTKTKIDSNGVQKLHEIVELAANDTWDLFVNLQIKNPYTKQMRLAIGKAYDAIYKDLLPKRISKDYIVFGIQGGPASFNDTALADYVIRHSIKNYKIKYLYTTEKVLKNLHAGNIDYGLFAMHNSVGGVVTESIQAIAKYKFKIVEDFAIKIRHFLMKRPNVKIENIDKIIAHDQVLKQCVTTLRQRYSYLKQETGKGDLIDTATAAKAIIDGKLNENVYILGNKMIADLYDFEIVDSDLQDDKENYTSFLLVQR